MTLDDMRSLVGIQTVSAEEYHAWPGASASRLRAFHGDDVTDAQAKVKLDTKIEPTPEMIFGTLCHAAILEPQKPLPGLEVIPEKYPDGKGEMKPWHMGATYCKEWVARAKHSGLIPIKADSLEDLKRSIEAASRACEPWMVSPDGDSLGDSEVSVVAWDEQRGFPIKMRMDFIPDAAFLADFKFTTDLSEDGWAKHAYRMGYHIQAALYLDTWNEMFPHKAKDAFRFVCVLREPPYSVRFFDAHKDSDFIWCGRDDRNQYLRRYIQSVRSGLWEDYSLTPVPMALPGYVKRNRANEYGRI